MIVLLIFGLAFVGSILFAMLRVSVSCMFWFSKKPKNKAYVFKIYFPCYIILLFGLCIAAIIKFNHNPFAIYFFGSIFFLALFIWRHEMTHIIKNPYKTKIAVEPNLPIYHEQPIISED